MKKILLVAMCLLAIVSLSSCEKDDLLYHNHIVIPNAPEKTSIKPDNGDEDATQAKPSTPAPANEDNFSVMMRGPEGITATAVIIAGEVHSVNTAITPAGVKLLSWHQDSAGQGVTTLSIEYEDTDGLPRRFSFCPSDDEYRSVAADNIAAGRNTVYSIDLYTFEASAE